MSQDAEDRHEGDAKVIGLVLKCERCGEKFTYEFNFPIAVSCVKCNSVFDARMQIYRQSREEVDRITSL